MLGMEPVASPLLTGALLGPERRPLAGERKDSLPERESDLAELGGCKPLVGESAIARKVSTTRSSISTARGEMSRYPWGASGSSGARSSLDKGRVGGRGLEGERERENDRRAAVVWEEWEECELL